MAKLYEFDRSISPPGLDHPTLWKVRVTTIDGTWIDTDYASTLWGARRKSSYIARDFLNRKKLTTIVERFAV